MKTVPNPAVPGGLRPVHLITDRAKRYRAQAAISAAEPRHCHYCGAAPQRLDVEHIDGDESNTNQANLTFACRACNTAKGAHYARTGKGVKTRQFNPNDSLEKYAHDMRIARGLEPGDKDAAWGRIMARSKRTRSEYTAQLWEIRRARGTTQTGRQSEIPF